MDIYPINLVLTVVLASATILLGFLPSRPIGAPFFAHQTITAGVAWIFIALTLPPGISHYYYFFAILCFGAWWQLRRDRPLSGKMWLSVASGLGISIGVMLILAVMPRAYPPDTPQPGQGLLLASIYLGGSSVGLAYVCYILTQSVSNDSGVAISLVQRYIGLLVILVFVRVGVLVTRYFELGFYLDPHLKLFGLTAGTLFHPNKVAAALFLVGVALMVLPFLALLAQRAISSRSPSRATYPLVGLCVIGFFVEIVARLLLL